VAADKVVSTLLEDAGKVVDEVLADFATLAKVAGEEEFVRTTDLLNVSAASTQTPS
jgi:hypothetical protein